MTAIQGFSIPQGDDRDVVFTINPNDDIALGGATVSWQVYAMSFAVPDPTRQLITKDSGAGGITVLASPGQFTVHLAAADTAALVCGNYYHEAEVIDADEHHATVCQGPMTVTLAVIP